MQAPANKGLKTVVTDKYKFLNKYVLDIKNQLACSAAATYIIHQDVVVNEFYSGSYEYESDKKIVEAPTRFNVASVRKSYIGFAIALAVHQQKIASIDDEIADYLVDLDTDIVRGTTIRHLLTHTHGLLSHQERRFPAGTGWHYNNVGIKMLSRLIQQVFGMSLAQVMMHTVFRPCHLMETGWTKNRDGHLVWLGEEYTSESGDQANLFVSARDLAFWGYLHLNKGFIQGKQIIPRDIFEQTTTSQSPPDLDDRLPRNGYAWWIQDKPRAISEIGSTLPSGTYQILGITGCACLVIPDQKIVAVRMYNQAVPNPPGYNYLEDIRSFGDQVLACIFHN